MCGHRFPIIANVFKEVLAHRSTKILAVRGYGLFKGKARERRLGKYHNARAPICKTSHVLCATVLIAGVTAARIPEGSESA